MSTKAADKKQTKNEYNNKLPSLDLGRYDEKVHPPIAHTLAQLGYSQKQTSEVLGISQRTFTLWLKKHDELNKQWYQGIESAEKMVESSLFSITQPHKKVTEEIWYDENGNIEKKKEKTEDVDPDSRACLRWLGIHDEKWREEKQAQMQGVTVVINKEDAEL